MEQCKKWASVVSKWISMHVCLEVNPIKFNRVYAKLKYAQDCTLHDDWKTEPDITLAKAALQVEQVMFVIPSPSYSPSS